MKRSETAEVLAVIAGVDRREVTALVVDAWHEVLAPLVLEECREAVRRHRQRSAEWITPAHVWAIVTDELAVEARERRHAAGRLEEDVALYEALGGSREEWLSFGDDLGLQQRAIESLQRRRALGSRGNGHSLPCGLAWERAGGCSCGGDRG